MSTAPCIVNGTNNYAKSNGISLCSQQWQQNDIKVEQQKRIAEQRRQATRQKQQSPAPSIVQQPQPQQQSSFFSYLNPVAAVQNITSGVATGIGAVGQGLASGVGAVTEATGITNYGQSADVNTKLSQLKDNLNTSCKMGVYSDQAAIDYNNCRARTKQVRQTVCPALSAKSSDTVCDNNNTCTTVGQACAAGGARKRTHRNKKSKKSGTKKHKKSTTAKKSHKKRSTRKKNN